MRRPISSIWLVILAVMLILGIAAPRATALDYGCTWTFDSEFDQGDLDGVNHEVVHDQIQLNKNATTFGFAWISNSADGTVSKIDTATGQEVARYRTGQNGPGDDPSRTAVDIDGNCWVANRAGGLSIPGTVIKILLEGGVDRNSNGVIDTSSGPGDIKPWWEDERVVISVPVGSPGTILRALTIDRDGNIWVGLWAERKYCILDGQTGAQIGEVSLTSSRDGHPYGAAIDRNGILWSACLGWGVDKINTVTRAWERDYNFGGGYGIAVDGDGIVWEGAYVLQGIFRLDPTTNAWVHCPSNGFTGGRGVCVDDDGNVWLALGYGSPNNKVAKYAPNGSLIATFDVGLNPCGVGTDFDGNIIVVCQGVDGNIPGHVYKINKNTGAWMWDTVVGRVPYTYSDFTGFNIRNITQQTGTWDVVFDSHSAGTPWCMAQWTCDEPADTSVTVQVRCADVQSNLSTQPWTDVVNGSQFGPMFGQFIEVRTRLTTATEVSPILYDLTVKAWRPEPETILIRQAYPGSSGADCETACQPTESIFHGGSGQLGDPVTCVPGILAIDPGDYAWAPGADVADPDDDILKQTWSNFVRVAYINNSPWFDRDDHSAPANSYYIKNVELVKTRPFLGQAFDDPCWQQAAPLRQQGSENIRLWWPLMFEAPGTTWNLTVTYATRFLFDDDFMGPNPPSYVHTETWRWQIHATLDSLICAIQLFHELPQGCCQVPLISGDRYWFFTNRTLDATDDFGNYGSLYLQLLGVLQATLDAAGDPTTQGELLTGFELLVSDQCVFACPANGAVSGPNVGIVQTVASPACYKLLIDAEYIARTLDAFQNAKSK